MLAIIKLSKIPEKKYEANIIDNGYIHSINFGASGYEDYTIHHDKYRKQRYIERHKGEDWTDPFKAGFWSKNLLWNKPTLEESAEYITKKFGFKVVLYF